MIKEEENVEKRLSERILEKDFPPIKAGIFGGNDGYDKTRVDLFLDEIASEVEQLENKYEEKEQKLKHFEEQTTSHVGVTSKPTMMNDSNDVEVLSFDEEIETSQFSQDEDFKREMRKVKTLERSYRNILFMAEEEAEKIVRQAKEEARAKMLEAHKNAELLLNEVNARCAEKEKQYNEVKEKETRVFETLAKVQEEVAGIVDSAKTVS